MKQTYDESSFRVLKSLEPVVVRPSPGFTPGDISADMLEAISKLTSVSALMSGG